jgi:hypothetical protein
MGPSYYEINVSKDGQHFFATASRSLTDKRKMEQAFEKFKEAFPEEEGYKIRVTYWEAIGKEVDGYPSIGN